MGTFHILRKYDLRPNRVRVQQHPHGLFSVSIPRAQALRIEKDEEWVLEGGELVLKMLGKLKE